VLRNICAHFGYLFQREFSVRPRLFREFGWPLNSNGSLFALCLVIRRLSEKQKWQEFIGSIDEKSKNDHSFVLLDYGFPDDWKGYLA
jgi:abortive infection bacteriophage resistance protein